MTLLFRLPAGRPAMTVVWFFSCGFFSMLTCPRALGLPYSNALSSGHIVMHWAVVRDSHLQGVTLGQHSVWHERCGSPSPGCHISPHALFPLHPHQKGEILALRDIFRQTSGLSITTCITWERSICPIFYFYSWNSFWTDSFKTANLLLYTGFQPRRKQNTWVAFWSVPS